MGHDGMERMKEQQAPGAHPRAEYLGRAGSQGWAAQQCEK